MKNSLYHELRGLLPVWLGCVLLPVPALLLARSAEGVPWRFCFFSITCATLATYVFRHETKPGPSPRQECPDQVWGERMATLLITLAGSVVLFSLFCLAVDGSGAMISVFKAVYISILAACIVPCLTLATRKPLAAVVFSIMLVFCMKLLGCLLVVLIYGWNADKLGYTTTPWAHPNLLVWFFWISTALLSGSLHVLGKRHFYQIYATSDTRHDVTHSGDDRDLTGTIANLR